jgi:sporulation protein YlmC with PRC-barrel domain
MKLDLGSHVRTSDGRDIGKVDRIILETRSMTVREFVVHKGLFFGHDRFASVGIIDHIDHDGVVHLKITAERANELPEFMVEQHFPVFSGSIQPRPDVYIITQAGSVPRDAVVLSHRTEAYDVDGHYVGYLDKVEYSEDGRVTHLILEVGVLALREITVPVEIIGGIRHDRITLLESIPKNEEPVVPLT